MSQVRTGIRARSDKSPAVAWGREDAPLTISNRRVRAAGLCRRTRVEEVVQSKSLIDRASRPF